MRLGQNYFETCETCGMHGHAQNTCPLKNLYHSQAERQVLRGSRDPELLREVYGSELEKQEPYRC